VRKARYVPGFFAFGMGCSTDCKSALSGFFVIWGCRVSTDCKSARSGRIANPRDRFGTDCKSARSGFIYIDADNADAIPESPYILASRKSLSDTGFRILVKVDNLTADNYADVDPSVAAMPNVQKINDMRLSSQ
jgi:hypothetical protein